jgi:hypothetical protein
LYPLQFQGGGRRPVVKIIAESLSQHDEKHVVPTPLSGIRVGRRRPTPVSRRVDARQAAGHKNNCRIFITT